MELSLIFIFIFISVALWGKHREKKLYNKGFCPHCGNRLRHFDTDSQGGRGYTCDNCIHYIWISYNVDKNHNS